MELRCGGCDIVYSMPNTLYKKRKEDGGAFYCPNGCAREFSETDLDKLKRLNSALNKKVDDLNLNTGALFLRKFLTMLCPDCRSVKLTPKSNGRYLCWNCNLVNEGSKMKWKVNTKRLNEYFNKAE